MGLDEARSGGGWTDGGERMRRGMDGRVEEGGERTGGGEENGNAARKGARGGTTGEGGMARYEIARRPKRRGKKKALCGNRRPSNDCLPYENSSKDRCW